MRKMDPMSVKNDPTNCVHSPTVCVKQEPIDLMVPNIVNRSLPFGELTDRPGGMSLPPFTPCCPNTSLLTVLPPCYGANKFGLARQPTVFPYETPFQTPNPSPLSSVQSSPVTSQGASPVPIHLEQLDGSNVNVGQRNCGTVDGQSTSSLAMLQKGIDDELAMILESEPFLWGISEATSEHQGQAASVCQYARSEPPPYPKHSMATYTSSLNNLGHQSLDSMAGRPTPRPASQSTSRTQLKQQLQREQLEQQERKERQQVINRQSESIRNKFGYANSQSEDQHIQASSIKRNTTTGIDIICPTAGHSVPLVDVPSQVLQVETRLEHPTRYYVLQKQKRQIRQFLQGVQPDEGALSGSSVERFHRPQPATSQFPQLSPSSTAVPPSDQKQSYSNQIEVIGSLSRQFLLFVFVCFFFSTAI